MNIFNETLSEKVKTEQIQVDKNIITFNDHSIQISNISQLTAGTPPNRIPIKTSFIFIISLFLTSFNSTISTLGILLSGCYIAYIIWQNMNKGVFIMLHLNSSFTFNISCQTQEFAEEIRRVIESCINEHKSGIIINMEQCDIQNSPLLLGKNGSVNYEINE